MASGHWRGSLPGHRQAQHFRYTVIDVDIMRKFCRAPKAGREIVASTVNGLPMSSPSQTWRNRRTICESKDGEDDFFPWCRLGHILSIWTKCVREIAKDQAANGSRFFMTFNAMGGLRIGSRSRRRRRTASSSGGASGRRERKRCGRSSWICPSRAEKRIARLAATPTTRAIRYL